MSTRLSSATDRKLFAARLPACLARPRAALPAFGAARTFSDRASRGVARTGRTTGWCWLPRQRRPVEISSYAAYLAGLDRICT